MGTRSNLEPLLVKLQDMVDEAIISIRTLRDVMLIIEEADQEEGEDQHAKN